jgi:asparagine synthase (glutamine-hydrolysing)
VDHALVGEERPAAHLSGGRDSAVVAATAALQLKSSGRTLVAFTSVPNTNTFLPSGAFVGDEGPAAAKVAALHPNIDHRRAVTSNFPLCTVLDQVNALLPGPHGTPVNLPWWTDIIKQASALGSALILTGAAGNMTVSAGGPWGIRDLLHTRDYRGWLKAISAAARVPQTSLLSLLDSSFGPSLPPGVYDLVKKVSGKAPHVWGRFVTGELGQHVRDLSASDMRQPELRQRLRYEMLENWNFSDPTSELLFGVSLRDPTAARNVVDASLALSLRELATPYDRRPTYEAAFKDRVPPEVLHKGAHGLQAADWATMIDPHDLRERFEVYAQSRSVAEYLDLQAVRQALARWPAPTQPCPEWEVYTLELLPAISLASFLHVHWPD